MSFIGFLIFVHVVNYLYNFILKVLILLNLFESFLSLGEAKANAPCVIFIDELDAAEYKVLMSYEHIIPAVSIYMKILSCFTTIGM